MYGPKSPGLFRKRSIVRNTLDHESLDLVLERADLAHEVGGLVGGDAAADDSAADTAGTAESHLAGDVNLEGKMLGKVFLRLF